MASSLVWVGDSVSGHWEDPSAPGVDLSTVIPGLKNVPAPPGTPAPAPADNRTVSVPDPKPAPAAPQSNTPVYDPLAALQAQGDAQVHTGAFDPLNPRNANATPGGKPLTSNVVPVPFKGVPLSATLGITPDAGQTTKAPVPTSSTDEAANRARQLADAAAARHTDPSSVNPVVSQADGTVDKSGTTQAGVNVQVAPRTTVPNPLQADKIGGVPVNYGPTVTADKVASPEISQSGANLQGAAANTYQDILAGRGPSVAEQQLKAAQDRAAAEQLSIAAGARGQGVVSARRNAATNIGLQQQQNAGQYAELRAKEIADAAAGLSTTGAALQGENLQASGQLNDVNKSNQAANLEAGKSNAANTIDVSKTNAANAIDVAKTNQAADLTAKQATAANQLKADISSDDRIQSSLNLAAELQQRAAAGDQSAAVQLNALKAQLTTQIAQFNATQIQTANAANIENRLRAMGLDDQLVSSLSQQFIVAANNNDQAKLDAIKTSILATQAKNQKTGNDLNALAQGLGLTAKYGPDFVKWLSGGDSGTDSTYSTDADGNALDANGDPLVMSDKRTKKDVREVDPKDIDGFLRAIGKSQTWEYKDPSNGEGRKMGPMAQDMEADNLARAAVGEKGGAKALDYQKLTALALAGLGRLNERVEEVEKPRGKRAADAKGFLVAVGRR